MVATCCRVRAPGTCRVRRADQRGVSLSAQGRARGIQAGLEHAIAKGWLVLHESSTYVWLTDAGATLFALRRFLAPMPGRIGRRVRGWLK
jgi:hypothetical protein